MEFLELERITGEHIRITYSSFIQKMGLTWKNVGESDDDGAANMNSQKERSSDFYFEWIIAFRSHSLFFTKFEFIFSIFL